jgi:hypothetical protein
MSNLDQGIIDLKNKKSLKKKSNKKSSNNLFIIKERECIGKT